ncbi:MAG: hypothetical protein ABJN69_04055 [Hellea sp.]
MTDRINYQASKPSFDMGRVLGRAFAGVLGNIKSILFAIALAIILSTVVTAPIYMLDLTDPAAVMETNVYGILTATSSILGFVLMMSICVFTDHMAFAQFTNRSAGFRYVLLRSIKLTLPVLFVVILYFLSSYIGMAFLIVPGVIISVGWAVIGPAYLHESTSLFGSFGRSWSLTRGYKWWVWLATIIMTILVWFIFIVGTIILSAVSLANIADPEMALGFTPKQFFVGLVINLFMYLAISLYASFTTALYTELRELKEGPLGEEMSAIFD